MGCAYNIKPVRLKDLPYFDVLSESVNNPLRMLAGWYMTGILVFAPLSLLLSYWMVGCYFMAIKRYSEYRDIGDPTRAAAYRKSFGYYTPERLLVSIVFYASAAMLFLGAFIMRYRLELILVLPVGRPGHGHLPVAGLQDRERGRQPGEALSGATLDGGCRGVRSGHGRAAGRRHPGRQPHLPADHTESRTLDPVRCATDLRHGRAELGGASQ